MLSASRRSPVALVVVSPARAVLLGTLLMSLVFASSAIAAGPATVTVRVEGATETLVPPTQLTTTTAPVVKDGEPTHSCTGTSAAGALQLATGGNWSGKWFSGLGYSVETIAGQSYPFTQPYYWNFWLDNKPSTAGICEVELNPGDSVLFYPECFSETSGVCPSPPNPLGIEAPATAEVGKPITIAVTSYASSSGTPSAAAGVTVTGGTTPVVTDSSGHATLTFSASGSLTIGASAPESVRTEAAICIHNGNDGTCGTTKAAGSSGSTAGSTTSTGSVTVNAPYKGPYALVAKASSVSEGRVYKRGQGPRVLSGSVLSHTTVTATSLELRREHRGRCYAYNGVTTRFARARCGAGSFFKVSNNGVFSYLLPAALAPGRYVLDIEATDAAGNRTTPSRGTTRIVFYVG
jgi:hypothetical protein